MYDVRPAPSGRESITIGDGRRLRIEYVGNINITFHEYVDERNTLVDVSYVPGLGLNQYTLHEVQRVIVISRMHGKPL